MSENHEGLEDEKDRVPEHEEMKPLEVIVTNQPKEKEKNPTSYDTKDEYDYTPTDEEIKEMTDAQ